MKLVLTRKEGAPEQRLLFDVAKDPAEKNDLGGSRQELVSKLDSDLNAILAHMEATSVRPGDRTLTPELEEHLKALGYVQ